MKFSIEKSVEILERTPKILATLLVGLSEEWTHKNEGGESWSAFDIIGHLIHGEETDWMIRAKIILSDDDAKEFEPFDRFAQSERSVGKNLDQLLSEFAVKRNENIKKLLSLNLQESELNMKGMHPELGEVSLAELISTWVVHDLNHLGQIARVMAFQYKSEVGFWQEYLRILKT